jgi:hypothetical protein
VAETELPEPIKEALGEGGPDKPFTRRVALVTAIYAVVLAVASMGGNNTMKETLLAQQQASDQWAFYQAKVIREHLYRANARRIELDLLERGPVMRAEARTKYEELQKQFADEAKRYSDEKKEIEKDAKKLEHERDVGKARDPNFDFSEALLQIAIVVASISILARSGALFGVSVVFAAVGTGLCANGFFLFAHFF